MDNHTKIASKIVASRSFLKKLTEALNKYQETGEGKHEVRKLVDEMKYMSAYDIMNLVRQMPGIENKDMSKFPGFRRELNRAMKQLRTD